MLELKINDYALQKFRSVLLEAHEVVVLKPLVVKEAVLRLYIRINECDDLCDFEHVLDLFSVDLGRKENKEDIQREYEKGLVAKALTKGHEKGYLEGFGHGKIEGALEKEKEMNKKWDKFRKRFEGLDL